jgi:hypothetical protein
VLRGGGEGVGRNSGGLVTSGTAVVKPKGPPSTPCPPGVGGGGKEPVCEKLNNHPSAADFVLVIIIG